MNYTQLSTGSQGDDVKRLQQALTNAGYSVGSTGVDGIYGSNTASAVRSYQQANGLQVDGIAGDQTLGKLYGAATTPSASTPTATTPATDTSAAAATTPATATTPAVHTGYVESDAVKQAQALLQQQMAQKPGAYQSQWQAQLDEIMGKYLNRGEFSYDLNADALYNQYKDRYVQQGKMAMMDTMGQAAALTGGYGNSYAQTAGQQAYQNYLNGLNDVMPELYRLALDRYTQQGQDLLNMYGLIGEREDLDYGRYRDEMSDYNTELERYLNQYNAERDFDYSKYADDRNYQYQVERDKIADEQWQKEFDEALRQFNVLHGASGGSSGGGSSGRSSGGSSYSGSSSGGGYNNMGYSSAVVKLAQQRVGATADGMWGSASQAAAQRAGYSDLSQIVEAFSLDSQVNGTSSQLSGKPPAQSVSFSDVHKEALARQSRGQNVASYLASAKSAGYITTAQYKSLRTMLGV